jgi:hypothetical protein
MAKNVLNNQENNHFPNGRKFYQMDIKFTNIARPFRIYPNFDFGLKIYHLATLRVREMKKVRDRVARGVVFKPKSKFWVNLGWS